MDRGFMRGEEKGGNSKRRANQNKNKGTSHPAAAARLRIACRESVQLWHGREYRGGAENSAVGLRMGRRS
eukprot:scaffold8618_cov56-Isochrysis_galbana.AAC.1